MKNEKVLDIVALVKENPIANLSGSYESKLINKIKVKFTKSEQQLFLASFYCYLNNNPLKDYVIDLDNIWGWIGFSRKEHAKRLLKRCFSKDKDYVIKYFATTVGVAKIGEKIETRGGKNKEHILLNIDTFKKFCIKADTDKANEIHDYYIKLENILHETAREESKELTNQLLLKDDELRLKEKELVLKDIEIKTVTTKKEKTLVNNFNEKSVNYIGYTEENLIKFGWSDNIGNRLRTHKKEIGKHFTFEYVFESVYNRKIEKLMKEHKIISKRIPKYDDCPIYNDKRQTEIIRLDNDFTIKDLYKIILEIKDCVTKETLENKDKEINKQYKEINELRQKMKKFEDAKIIDIQTNSMQDLIEKSFQLKKALCYNFLVDYIAKEILLHGGDINFVIKLTIDEIFQKYKQFRESNGFREPIFCEKYEKSIITKAFNHVSGITRTTVEINLISIRAKNFCISKIVKWICTDVNVPKRFRNMFRELAKKIISIEENDYTISNISDVNLRNTYNFLISLLIKFRGPHTIIIKNRIVTEEYLKFVLQNGYKKQTMTYVNKILYEIPSIKGKRIPDKNVKYARITSINVDKTVKWINGNLELPEKTTYQLNFS